MMRRLIWQVVVFSALLSAQTYTASVRGTVTDQTKAVVPAATVTLREVSRNLEHTATTDAAGRYVVMSLLPGTYTLTVVVAGFQNYSHPAFQLEVQQQATINVELAVAGVNATVEVQGTAPLLNTAVATLGQVVENKFIQTLPMAARNPLALVMLTAGIVPSDTSAGGTANVNFVANGVRNSTSEAILDSVVITGIAINSGITTVEYTPSVDLIEEFKVQTNFFSAEFGTPSIINMLSKSGTNEPHGVVYEFARNAALNANSFFSNRQGRTLADSKQNLFGGTLGGPVFIPKLYNGKNRTFFFVDFEGTRADSATTTTGTVPTALQRAGDFSDTRRTNGALYPIYNPFDTYTAADGRTLRHAFPGNVIPPSMQSPIAQKLISYYPQPTSDGAQYTHVNNFFNQGTNGSVSNQMDVKIDHNISAKQRFTSRYSVNWGHNDPVNLTGNISDDTLLNNSRRQNFLYDYTRIQSPTTIISARMGLTRLRSFRDAGSTGFDPTSLGLPPIVTSLGVKQFPLISVSGYRAMGAESCALIRETEGIGVFNGSLTKIIGGHSFKTGAELRTYLQNFWQPCTPVTSFSFDRGVTGENPLVASSTQGDGLASMLLGWGGGGSQDMQYPSATAAKYFGIYAQDDWRLTAKLTLNLGLRYDFDVPRTERFNRLNWFDFYAPSPLQGKVPGSPNLQGIMRFADSNHRGIFNGDYDNIQPRIGLAYALGGKTAIRAGYGIFYSHSRAGVSGETGSAFFSSTGIEWSRDAGYTQFASFTNPFPAGLIAIPGRDPLAFLGLGFPAYDPNIKSPQWQQWNLSIQHTVPGAGVVEVAYAGGKGTHLYYGNSSNVLGNHNKLDPMYWPLGRQALTAQVPNPFYGIITDPRSVLSLPTVQYNRLLRPYPQYAGGIGSYMAIPNIGNSIYHSVQFKYEKRFSSGLALLAHYTISKLISDSDNSGSDDSWLGGNAGLQNWKNLRQERSLSAYDIPQRAVITSDYQLPIGRGRAIGNRMNKAADLLIGGWELSAMLTFSSGYPIVTSLGSPVMWDADQRPNLIGNPATSGSPIQRLDQYFNVNAFSQPASDTYGNAPRTLSNYRTFGIRNGDLTLMKNVRLKERKSLQVRLESYNVTNTPTFGRPNQSYGSNSFGIISGYASGRGARVVQVAAKFYY